ncbi:MAG: CHAP domain-containing protein [Candidatus Saccharimonadales bacterium]
MKKIKRQLLPLILKFKNAPFLAAVILLISVSATVVIVHADSVQDLQQEIDNLNAENTQNQGALSALQLQASSYQDAINRLQQEVAGVEQSLATNQNTQASLQQQITIDQATITNEKVVLGDDIKAMYVDGQMTTLEMLATSKNLSDFVNASTYRNAVQGKIQSTLTQIAKTQNLLQDQENQVQTLIQAEQVQQAQLNNDESQQNSLLALDQTQQDTYNQQIQSNNSQIKQFQDEQLAELAALEGNVTYGGTGSYPWASAPCLDGPGAGPTCGNYDWGYPYGTAPPYGAPAGPYDPWGYEYRNCTSYVAWKIDSLSSSPIIGSVISDLGNAAQWPSGASARGVPVSYGSNPQYGDAAVDPGGGGWQGHVMYVEAVNGNGSILVSQYNAGEDGTYSMATIAASQVSSLVFIQFPGM